MESHPLEFALRKNLSIDENWTRAVEEVEHIVGSEAPLAGAPDGPSARAKRRRSLARPLALSLFFASGIVVALALGPAAPNNSGGAPSWQFTHR